jgi:3-mercaptopyruvate sulfurtransferase SseA
VAHLLQERGFNTFVIVGGLTAWRKAGQPLESIPKNDLIKPVVALSGFATIYSHNDCADNSA